MAPSLPDSLTGPSTASRVPAHIWASPPPSSLPAHRPWAEGLTAGAELGPPLAGPQRWLPQGCVLSPTLLNSVLRSSCSRAVENILPTCILRLSSREELTHWPSSSPLPPAAPTQALALSPRAGAPGFGTVVNGDVRACPCAAANCVRRSRVQPGRCVE